MATQSQSVPAGGGTVSVTLGAQKATVTIPSGALAGPATIKLTLYAANALPNAFAKARRTESVPTGGTAIVGLVIDDGGVALNAPLTVSFAEPSGPATGQSVLLSGYANGAYDDVSTTTYAAGAYSLTPSTSYPGITLASQTPYVLYSVATSNVAAPSAIVTVAGPATLGTASQGTYTATETTANGFPFLGHTFTFSVDNMQLGTIVPSTGVLTGGGIGGVGNVVATDAAVSSFSGKLSVAVTTARPGASGLTEKYTGTLTEIDANNEINPSPAPSATPVQATSTAAATVNISAAQATDGSGNVVFTANESDAANLTTLTAATVSTVAYQTQNSGKVNVRTLKSVATESSGVVYEHDYGANNGLLTVLPEAAGTFSNDAAEEFKETDPGIGITASGTQGVTTDRVVASNGTYTANIVEPDVYYGMNNTDVATENSDFSGQLALNSIDPNAFVINFGAPSGGNIPFAIVDPNFGEDDTGTTLNWIPSSLSSPSVETDSISAVSTLDPSCSPTAGLFTTSAMLITQHVTTADVVYGTLENRTTKTYDVNGTGTVCTVVSDVVSTFYDYSEQEGPYIIFFAPSATVPDLTTTMTETLSLQTTNVATVASTKRTSQATVAAAPAVLPVSILANRVQHLARARQAARMQIFRTKAAQLRRGGSVK